ncbi:hypothetical protein CgunFtcFv8_009207 [Champsocephalus gunnari]|uniref:Dynein heavy chain ATP-binding dynein motor region domain-containing protein n=1 Tax=Champsocephalus gunnari TaxID=52237 RepID=A0AAN8C2B4_CHAGU|nr:hypothetical protein CgunFtcFv8_009207 [Champsocephalus gunnari]
MQASNPAHSAAQYCTVLPSWDRRARADRIDWFYLCGALQHACPHIDRHLERLPPTLDYDDKARKEADNKNLSSACDSVEIKCFCVYYYDLTKQQNGFKITLKTLEDSLLSRLSLASGNFLGDTELVENLETTKRTAGEIEEKVK